MSEIQSANHCQFNNDHIFRQTKAFRNVEKKNISERIAQLKSYLISNGYKIAQTPIGNCWGYTHFHEFGFDGQWPVFEIKQWLRVVGIFELNTGSIALCIRKKWNEGHTHGYYDVEYYGSGYLYTLYKYWEADYPIENLCVEADLELRKW